MEALAFYAGEVGLAFAIVGAQHAVPGKHAWLLVRHSPRANGRLLWSAGACSRCLAAGLARACSRSTEVLAFSSRARSPRVILSGVSRAFAFARSAGTRSRRIALRCPGETALSVDRPRPRRDDFEQVAIRVSKIQANAAPFPRMFLLQRNSSLLEPSLPPGQFRSRNCERYVQFAVPIMRRRRSRGKLFFLNSSNTGARPRPSHNPAHRSP